MSHDHRLLFHAFLLFLLGLATGLVADRLENPRMGVSAHVEAILNGVFLVGLGVQFARPPRPLVQSGGSDAEVALASPFHSPTRTGVPERQLPRAVEALAGAGPSVHGSVRGE